MIVDDEELARNEMRYLLSDEEDIEIVGEVADGQETVRMVKEKRPDLIFLDIQMPGMDGFQVMQALLDAGTVPLIIFATAYDQYAIRAFEVNALDYLLKPIEKKRLREALDRARRVLPRQEEFTEKIRKLAGSIKIGTRFLPKLVLRRGEAVTLIEVEKVALLQQEGLHVKAFTSDGDFMTNYRNLDEIEVQLDPSIFIRLGGEYIINLRRVSGIVPWSGGHYLLTLDDAAKTEVRLTRSQAKLLKNKVGGSL